MRYVTNVFATQDLNIPAKICNPIRLSAKFYFCVRELNNGFIHVKMAGRGRGRNGSVREEGI